MALVRRYKIKCDNCGKECQSTSNVYVGWQDSPRHARQAARDVGWLSMSRDRYSTFARLDYCPDCAAIAPEPGARKEK